MSNHKHRIERLEAKHPAHLMTWREFIECDDIEALPDPDAWRALVADRLAPIVPEVPGAPAPDPHESDKPDLATAEGRAYLADALERRMAVMADEDMKEGIALLIQQLRR